MLGAIYEPFDVVVVPYPFTDRHAPRRRPALVVSSPAFSERHGGEILAIITTVKDQEWSSDVSVRDWRGAGLPSPCKVRARFFTLDRDMILRRIGSLSAADRRAVGSLLARAFAFG